MGALARACIGWLAAGGRETVRDAGRVVDLAVDHFFLLWWETEEVSCRELVEGSDVGNRGKFWETGCPFPGDGGSDAPALGPLKNSAPPATHLRSENRQDTVDVRFAEKPHCPSHFDINCQATWPSWSKAMHSRISPCLG